MSCARILFSLSAFPGIYEGTLATPLLASSSPSTLPSFEVCSIVCHYPYYCVRPFLPYVVIVVYG